MNVFSIRRHQQRIENVFARTDGLPYDEEQLRSDLARYLCVLVAGFIEQSLQTIYGEYAKGSASPKIVRFLERQLARSTNFSIENLLQLVSAFDNDWAEEIKTHRDFDRYKSAVDAVYANRNKIAHGVDVGISYDLIREYCQAHRRGHPAMREIAVETAS